MHLLLFEPCSSRKSEFLTLKHEKYPLEIFSSWANEKSLYIYVPDITQDALSLVI